MKLNLLPVLALVMLLLPPLLGLGELTTPPPTTAVSTQTPTPTKLPVSAGTPVPQPVIPISIKNAAQVTQLARWGAGYFTQVSLAADGRLLVVASSTGVYLYDSQTLVEVAFFETRKSVTSVALSPDGQVLAASLANHHIYLWRLTDGKLMRILKGHVSTIVSLIFSPDGTVLASGSEDSAIRLWRVTDGALLYVLQRHTDDVLSVAFSPDGRWLASGSRDGTVRLWGVRPLMN